MATDFKALKPKSPHGMILAVSMMKDEAPYLLEWYAHHLAVGFTDILVYTNDCSDGTVEMLQRLEELGLGYHRYNIIADGVKPQPSAIRYAQDENIVARSDWMCLFDADEFLSINHPKGTISEMLDDAGDANGIVITWRIFGSGNVLDWSDDPVTEQYLYAAPATWNKGWGVKTLFKFDPEYWRLGIHRPKIKSKHLKTGFPETVHWLNGSGRPMEDYFKFRGWRSIRRTVGYDWAQMNHYAVKSVDAYAIRKLRGNVNNKKDKYNADYWSLQDRNEVKDIAILKHSEKRAEIMAALLTDPVLKTYHEAALARVHHRLGEIKQTPEYKALKAELVKASLKPITQVVAEPPQKRDPNKIADLMSQVEKANSARPKQERRTAPGMGFMDIEDGADGYVPEVLDRSLDIPMEWVANHDVLLPGDARVFGSQALDLLIQGKFDRSTARSLSKLTQDDLRFLDISTGVGFLPILAKMRAPGAAVMGVDDRAHLLSVGSEVVAKNGLDPNEVPLSPLSVLEQTELSQPVLDLIKYFAPNLIRIAVQGGSAKLLDQLRAYRTSRIFISARLSDTDDASVSARKIASRTRTMPPLASLFLSSIDEPQN
ncbi:MAG: glycosyltransferase family 2 protein [Pseudomonadota bacterium]